MHFDSLINPPDFLVLSDKEKHGLKTPLCRTPVSELLQFATQVLSPTSPSPQFTNSSSSASCQVQPSIFATSHIPASTFTNSVVTNNDSRLQDKADQKATAIAYPPMPSTAQHISIVQERILRGSSAKEEPLSPDQADHNVELNSSDACLPSAEPPLSGTTVNTSTTVLMMTDSGDMQQVSSLTEPCSIERTTRHAPSTPRRSRIAARFHLMPKTDSVAAVASQPNTPSSVM
jgi:hypothetical protein